MRFPPRPKTKNLVIVAHPDDEVLFIGGHILQHRALDWEILCVTDANGGGRKAARMKEFEASCAKLNAKSLGSLDYPDIFDKRLDWVRLADEVSARLPEYDRVWTHGAIGEYGHIHHQDVSRAIHEAGILSKAEVWSFAYNSKPDLVTELDASSFGRKMELLVKTYGEETKRFINLLNCSYGEGFSVLDITEVRAIHDFLSQGTALTGLLPHFGMLRPWLESGDYFASLNSFFRNYFEFHSEKSQAV